MRSRASVDADGFRWGVLPYRPVSREAELELARSAGASEQARLALVQSVPRLLTQWAVRFADSRVGADLERSDCIAVAQQAALEVAAGYHEKAAEMRFGTYCRYHVMKALHDAARSARGVYMPWPTYWMSLKTDAVLAQDTVVYNGVEVSGRTLEAVRRAREGVRSLYHTDAAKFRLELKCLARADAETATHMEDHVAARLNRAADRRMWAVLCRRVEAGHGTNGFRAAARAEVPGFKALGRESFNLRVREFLDRVKAIIKELDE